jgi:hypothetical protein
MSVTSSDPAFVRIGRYVVPGFQDTPPCRTCGRARTYHARYDAYFCARCNTWLETVCTHTAYPDPCQGRPTRPLSGCLTREGRAALPFALLMFVGAFMGLSLAAFVLGAAIGVISRHPSMPQWFVSTYPVAAFPAAPAGALLIAFRAASRYLLRSPLQDGASPPGSQG